MNTCRKCGLEKEGRDCKPCRAAYMRGWNSRNPEKVKASKAKKYIVTKEADNLRSKRWAESNRERSNGIKQSYKDRNREKYLAQQRKYARNRYLEMRVDLLEKRKGPESLKILAEWREKNRERLNAVYLESYHTNPDHKKKHKSRGKVNKALKSGELIKPAECSMCGLCKRLEGHHEDYEKPLEVIWLCKGCHIILHGKYFKLDTVCSVS